MTPPASEHPHLPILCGWIAIIGAASLVLAILVAGVVVPDHDWVADTISDLGAGQLEWIVDVGLYAFAGGLVALAIGAAHLHLGRVWWTVGVFSLATLGGLVIMVGARNEYGDSDNEGVVIHVYLVYLLGILFTLAPLAMAHGAGRVSSGYRRAFVGCGVVWALSAPVFFFLPTGIDGAYERYLGVVALTWTASLALLLIAHGRERQIDLSLREQIG